MLTLLFVFLLVLTVFCTMKAQKKDKDGGYYGLALFLGCISCLLFMVVVIYIIDVETSYTIDSKISMYETENAKIEEDIATIVESYMDFEASTYSEFKNESIINLVSLFPELQSNTLVQKEIEIYVANNDKLKELKEEKIDLSKLKWLLYFGK